MKALAKQIVGHGRKVVFDDAEAQKDYETLRVVQADARQLLAQLDALTRSSETCANDGKKRAGVLRGARSEVGQGFFFPCGCLWVCLVTR
jgi:hypothetical protein